MDGKMRWGIGLAALAVGILFAAGFHRIVRPVFAGPQIAWSKPFGSGPKEVGKAVGVDGRLYGPLAFTVHSSNLWILDTYRHRILELGQRGRRIAEWPLPPGVAEALGMTPDSRLLVADNKLGTIQQVSPPPGKTVVAIPPPAGYSQSVWHMEISPSSHIWVELIRMGQGRLQSMIRVYDANGKFLRQPVVSPGAEGSTNAAGIRAFVQNFALAPNGNLWLEQAAGEKAGRTLACYSADGHLKSRFPIKASVPVKDTELLGANANGWVYLGVNLNSGSGGRVLVFDSAGHRVADLAVPPEPVRSAVYGQVMPDGTFYLVQNSPKEFRLARYRLAWRRFWRWY